MVNNHWHAIDVACEVLGRFHVGKIHFLEVRHLVNIHRALSHHLIVKLVVGCHRKQAALLLARHVINLLYLQLSLSCSVDAVVNAQCRTFHLDIIQSFVVLHGETESQLRILHQHCQLTRRCNGKLRICKVAVGTNSKCGRSGASADVLHCYVYRKRAAVGPVFLRGVLIGELIVVDKRVAIKFKQIDGLVEQHVAVLESDAANTVGILHLTRNGKLSSSLSLYVVGLQLNGRSLTVNIAEVVVITTARGKSHSCHGKQCRQ